MDNRITIQGENFMLNGKLVWINGANTPWNVWNDFGGAYDDTWWNTHLAQLHESGANATRVWVNCNNEQGAVLLEEDGTVTGVSPKHWEHLDLFFAAAARNKIYIMATLLSFDHYKDEKGRNEAQRWRNMLACDAAVNSYCEHYVIPFVNRYKSNPYLWSIDLMNEPDWVHENPECGNRPWEDISRLFARAAAAIHENSPILVTVGMASPKYQCNGEHYEGNKVSDAFLQNIYPNPGAYLDFWSPHYYDWVGEHYGVPFTGKPYGTRATGGWGLQCGRPAVIAECPALGSKNSTITQDYTNAHANGWHGVMPWTSNGVDKCGGFDDLQPALQKMLVP
ncbi:MAG: cellulase family glycosylhydrolase [Defluviitaleaceae bacterium]|nr:cellulase family glycosylhydrolase [Defluviitaleaceae bacterium]MCL2275672.1 cellulase family glycosylhydrolase [Defluviitaleaceae bacterium]